MTSSRTSTGAVLAGSLAAFPLLEVLELLSRTKHSGALQVVGDTVDDQLWVDDGDLLEHGNGAAERLFTLASLHEAWFTVIPGTPPAGVADGERVALAPLIELVAPRVGEWLSLSRALPADAVVKMASTTPGPEVQIRSDQWHVLAVIGTGRPLHDVIDAIGATPLDTLRVVQELLDQHLVALESPAPTLTESADTAHTVEPAPFPELTRTPTVTLSVPAEAPPATAPVRPADAAPPWRERRDVPVEPEPVYASAEPAGAETPVAPLRPRIRARSAARAESAEPAPAAYMPPPVVPARITAATVAAPPEVTLTGRRASDQSV